MLLFIPSAGTLAHQQPTAATAAATPEPCPTVARLNRGIGYPVAVTINIDRCATGPATAARPDGHPSCARDHSQRGKPGHRQWKWRRREPDQPDGLPVALPRAVLTLG